MRLRREQVDGLSPTGYPFEGCTLLEAKASSAKMTVDAFFRFSHQESIKKRVAVLICLKTINNARMEEAEAAKRRRLNDGGSSSSSSSSSSSGGGNNNSTIAGSVDRRSTRDEFDGVLAEWRITAYELWREILTFL